MIETSRFTWLLSTLLLASCASQVPVNIRQAPLNSPLLNEVRDNVSNYQSQQVRWGGEILAIENRENITALTVLARPLSKAGKPYSTDSSQGRFIAHIPAFIEPEVYTTGREVTLRGTLSGTETRPVGEHPYSYPVVKATDWYLWPEAVEYPSDNYARGWYDNPWYYDPWYPYPYYYNLHHRHHHHKD
jgi:outer membrane lipoprotein